MKWIILIACCIFTSRSQAQVIITEIMADPSPSVALPEAEYVEIYNAGNESISLEAWQFSDGTKTATFPSYALAPQQWLTLCATSKVALFEPWGEVLGLPSFPSLNNGGETLVLLNELGAVVDSVSYHNNWYNDSQKKNGGWSLELQGMNSPCGTTWTASTHQDGGTPSAPNSGVNNEESSNIQLVLKSFSSTELILQANQQVIWEKALWSMEDDLGKKTMLNSPSSTGNDAVFSFEAVPKGKSYRLHAVGLEGCLGARLDTVMQVILGDKPQFLELIITEIMADPSPSIGLPEAEYLEIFNPTKRYIELTHCTLNESTKAWVLPDTIIPPQTYWVLMHEKNRPLFSENIAVLGLSSFPNLSNGGEYLALYREDTPLFEVTYDDAWYGSSWAAEGGFSLEMLRLNRPCMQLANWAASQAQSGGTPGRANSQVIQGGDERPPQLLRAYAPDSTQIRFEFDETLHPQIIAQLRLESESVQAVNFEVKGAEVRASISPVLQAGIAYAIKLIGIEDCASNMTLESDVVVHLASSADSGDVVINEVLPKPFTGGTRFIELHNRSEKYLNLQGWKVGRYNSLGEIDRVVTLTEDYLLLPPKGYQAFTADKGLLKAHYPQAIDAFLTETATALPTWGFDEEQAGVMLLSPQYEVYDQLFLETSMVFELIDDDRGVSVERLDANAPSDWLPNWRSAASGIGHASPGFANSQGRSASEAGGQWLVQPQVISPNQDGYQDYAQVEYQGLPYGTVANIIIFDSQGRFWKQLASNHLLGESGFYIWDGVGPHGNQAPKGAYIVYIEYFHSNGKSSRKKLVLAVDR